MEWKCVWLSFPGERAWKFLSAKWTEERGLQKCLRPYLLPALGSYICYVIALNLRSLLRSWE